jgi:hypothetical protein
MRQGETAGGASRTVILTKYYSVGEMNQNELGGECDTEGDDEWDIQRFDGETEEREHWEDLRLSVRKIFKCIFK